MGLRKIANRAAAIGLVAVFLAVASTAMAYGYEVWVGTAGVAFFVLGAVFKIAYIKGFQDGMAHSGSVVYRRARRAAPGNSAKFPAAD